MISRSVTGASENGNCRAAESQTPPPQGLSRGNAYRSTSSTEAPSPASSPAAVAPAGPAPTTTQS